MSLLLDHLHALLISFKNLVYRRVMRKGVRARRHLQFLLVAMRQENFPNLRCIVSVTVA